MTNTDDKPEGPFGVAKHSGPFAQVPSALLYDRTINAEAKLVYAVLATHANHNGVCWPRLAGIAGALGVKPPAVHAHITTLIEKGWLVRGLYADDRRRNAYRLIWGHARKPENASPPVKQSHQNGGNSFTPSEVIECFTPSELNSFTPSEVKNILSTEQTNVHVQGSVSAVLPEKRTELRVHGHAGKPQTKTQKLPDPEEQSQDPAPLAFTLNAWTALTKDAEAVAWLQAHNHNPNTWRYTDMLRAYTEYWEAHP